MANFPRVERAGYNEAGDQSWGIEQVLTPGQTAKQQEHREIQRQCGDHAWTVFACNNSSSGMEKHIEEETRRQNKCEKYENNRPYWKHPYDGRKDDGADDTGDMDRLVILLTVQRGCISLSPACESRPLFENMQDETRRKKPHRFVERYF